MFWLDDQVITSLLPPMTQSKLLKEKLDVLQTTKERMELQRKGFTATAFFSTHVITILWRMQVCHIISNHNSTIHNRDGTPPKFFYLNCSKKCFNSKILI